jgi:hypothetical protein
VFEQATPEVEWELGVTAAEASNEVVLECADGTFGGEHAVEPGGDKLPCNATGIEEVANSLGALVVEPMDFRFETTDGEVVIQFGGGSGQLHGGVGLEGLREDGVTIVIVEDHDRFVALAGGDGEASSLVGGDLSGRSGVVDDFGIHFVSSYADLIVGRDVELRWAGRLLEESARGNSWLE